jgi:hypothetical protein
VPVVVPITEHDAAEARQGHDEPSALLVQALGSLLICDIAIAAAGLVMPLVDAGDRPFQLQIDLKPVVILWRLAFAATVVVFLIWFYAARVSAERSGWHQRRARGWAFWGWFIPIADLWIPFQIMADIWKGSLRPSRRSKAAWLPAVWWISWLLEGLLSQGWDVHSSNFRYGLPLPDSWATFALLAVAGVSLVVMSQVTTRLRPLVSSDPVQLPCRSSCWRAPGIDTCQDGVCRVCCVPAAPGRSSGSYQSSWPGPESSRLSTAGSAPPTSTILVLADAPATRITA